MRLSSIDIAIIALYLLSTIFIGLWYRKKARENKESYMLGGRSLPWYKLGLSDASDMFDISGTMWMVSLCFVYGMKSIWIPWLWPVFNQVFLMMYLSRWLRRSQCINRCRMACYPVWQERAWRGQFQLYCHSFCLAQLSCFYGLWFYRAG